MSKVVENGNVVSIHYRGTFEDGTEFDSSHQRGETLTFKVGTGQMIPGFENGVLGMEIGEVKNISLVPAEAYGDHHPEAIKDVPKESFPTDFNFSVGSVVQGSGPEGAPIMATILKEEKESVTLDFNHPMAGKDLNFEIEVVSLEAENPTTEEE